MPRELAGGKLAADHFAEGAWVVGLAVEFAFTAETTDESFAAEEITIAYKHLLAHTDLSSDLNPATNSDSATFPKTPDNLLKYHAYVRLRDLFTQQRFASAIALVDALTSKLPDDLEVQQWCAIAYQQQGRRLMRDRRYPQALRYLKKALATNPTNRDLVAKLHQDLRSLNRQVQQTSFRSI